MFTTRSIQLFGIADVAMPHIIPNFVLHCAAALEKGKDALVPRIRQPDGLRVRWMGHNYFKSGFRSSSSLILL